MTWLRLDDGFDMHPKMLALGEGQRGDARRWTWSRVLLYAARRDDPEIPTNLSEIIPRATRSFLSDCASIGLLDRVEVDGFKDPRIKDDRLVIHDWALYANTTIERKVAYYLERNPEASANEIARAVGGMRAIALAEIKRQRGEEPGTDEHDSGIGTGRDGTGARAREPLSEPPNRFPSTTTRTDQEPAASAESPKRAGDRP